MDRRRGLLLLLPWAVVLLSLAATAALWRHERRVSETAMQSAFDAAVRQTASRIEQRLAGYEQMLRGLQGLMQSGAPPQRTVFERYVDAVLAGADVVGVRFFAFAPADASGALADWAFVAPPVPQDGRRAALGPPGDVALDEALRLARDAGGLRVTAWAVDGEGFRLVLPVFRPGAPLDGSDARRRALAGWVLAGVTLDDLQSSLYGENPPGLRVRLRDGVLPPVPAGDLPPLQTLEYIGLAGHTWSLQMAALPEFIDRHGRNEARAIVLAGVAFSAALGLITWLLVGGRERAHAVARKMTAELRASEARYRRIVETADEGIWVCDADGRTTFVNPKMAQLLGLPEAEVMGRRREDFGLEPDGSEGPGECRFRRQDGSVLWASCVLTPIVDAGGQAQGTLAMVTDISARREAERARGELAVQLRESQKMEAIGTLAGGIAHDFNNILAAVLGNVAIVLRHELAPAAREAVARINTSAVRARSLVQQILAFSRRQPTSLALQPLLPVIEEALGLLRPILPASVQLELRPTRAGALAVQADATQLQQVVMNLCNNAWHALQGQPGRITLLLDAVALQTPPRSAPALPAGRYARLVVSDTGCGMDEATRARVFEPFFTTKPVGQGTGLGLAVVHGIVAAHHGAISVRSAPGRGSSFEVLLPLAEAPAPASPLAPAEAAAMGPARRVVYVDDDPAMVAMVEALLQQAGFAVTCFDDPRAAVEALRAAPEPFDLLVTDYNMPGLSGLDVAAEAARRWPQMPVVISSGYVTEQMLDETAQVGVRAVIQKEYTVEQLPGLLRQLLAETRPEQAAA